MEEVTEKVQEETIYTEVKDPYGFIYITTNMVDGKRYLGQSTFKKGWKTYLGSGTILKKAIKRYGAESFRRNIIVLCFSQDELNQTEYDLTVFFDVVNSDSWYNLAYGGGGNSGFHPSEESRKKMSAAQKGKTMSEEAKRKISMANTGRVKSEDERKKISEKAKIRLSVPENNPMYGKNPYANKTKEEMDALRKRWSEKSSGNNNGMYGKHHSKETREKISEKLKVSLQGEDNPFYGKHHSEETKEYLRSINIGKFVSQEVRDKLSEKLKGKNNPKAHPVYCFELNEFFWGKQDVKDKYPNIPISNIGVSCNDAKRTCGKHPETNEPLHWRWATMGEYDNYIIEKGD